MPRKVKGQLPSGSYRVRVWDNVEKKQRSFTAPTKAEAEMLAQEWRLTRKDKPKLTIAAACERYIELKKDVLSPSTVKGYIFAKKRIESYPIGKIELSKLTNADVQLLVSDLASAYSPKYVRNVYGFLTAVIGMFEPECHINATLPPKKRVESYIPNTEDVQALIDAASSTEMKLAILFAAVGTMRRGEACAVTFDDVDYKNQTISINKAFVETPEYKWELKAPKTYTSTRKVLMPNDVFTMIKSLSRTDGTVLNMKPDRLYVRFKALIKAAGLRDFRYHDLRHYAASHMHAVGMPERYIEAVGGWKPGSGVLKKVYENVIDLEMVRQRKAYLNAYEFKI